MTQTVLVVDDDPIIVETIVQALEEDEFDYEVISASDGFEAGLQVNHFAPSLLILDIMMPKLSGFEMLELMDHQPVIIFSTAYDQYALKAFEQNAIDYLLKPYDQTRFDQALNKARNKLEETSHNTEILNLIK